MSLATCAERVRRLVREMRGVGLGGIREVYL